jgi:hypothetical protein
MRKETFMANTRYFSGIFPEVLRKATHILSLYSRLWAGKWPRTPPYKAELLTPLQSVEFCPIGSSHAARSKWSRSRRTKSVCLNWICSTVQNRTQRKFDQVESNWKENVSMCSHAMLPRKWSCSFMLPLEILRVNIPNLSPCSWTRHSLVVTLFAAFAGVSKSFRNESIKKYTLTTTNTRWEETQSVMAAKLTRLTHKIAIQMHLVAESCTICSSRSRWPVQKLLDIPSNFNVLVHCFFFFLLFSFGSRNKCV